MGSENEALGLSPVPGEIHYLLGLIGCLQINQSPQRL